MSWVRGNLLASPCTCVCMSLIAAVQPTPASVSVGCSCPPAAPAPEGLPTLLVATPQPHSLMGWDGSVVWCMLQKPLWVKSKVNLTRDRLLAQIFLAFHILFFFSFWILSSQIPYPKSPSQCVFLGNPKREFHGGQIVKKWHSHLCNSKCPYRYNICRTALPSSI